MWLAPMAELTTATKHLPELGVYSACWSGETDLRFPERSEVVHAQLTFSRGCCLCADY